MHSQQVVITLYNYYWYDSDFYMAVTLHCFDLNSVFSDLQHEHIFAVILDKIR